MQRKYLANHSLAHVDQVGRRCRLARAFAHRRPAQSAADLAGVDIELGQRAAERIAVHPELDGGFALIALMLGEDFEYVTPLELPYGLGVGDPGAVHLCDQAIQFALQVVPHLGGIVSTALENLGTNSLSMLGAKQSRGLVQQMFRPCRDPIFKVVGYNEG